MYEKYIYDITDFLIANNKPITFDYTAKYSLTDADFKDSLHDDNLLAQAHELHSAPKEAVQTKQTEQIEQIQINPIAATTTTVISDVKDKNDSDKSTEKSSDDDSKTYELLKKYRLDISKQENIKAYMVFNNEVLDSLVKIKPKTKEELLQIKDFGKKKVEKYGMRF